MSVEVFFSRFNCSMVYDVASIWMMFLFMLEKLHGPLNHLECSHDAATSGRVKSFFLQASNFIILTCISCLIIEHYAIS